jgi:hypothetical protein
MNRVPVRAYRVAMRLLPGWFQVAYGEEMSATFAARLEGAGRVEALRVAAAEIADLMVTSVRLHASSPAAAHMPFAGALAGAALLGIVMLGEPAKGRSAEQRLAADSVEFRGNDPAGAFTLTIKAGRPVLVTLDDMRVPGDRIVASGDSIRVLSPAGREVLTVAYYAKGPRIEWDPRDPSCRGRTLTCER